MFFTSCFFTQNEVETQIGLLWWVFNFLFLFSQFVFFFFLCIVAGCGWYYFFTPIFFAYHMVTIVLCHVHLMDSLMYHGICCSRSWCKARSRSSKTPRRKKKKKKKFLLRGAEEKKKKLSHKKIYLPFFFSPFAPPPPPPPPPHVISEFCGCFVQKSYGDRVDSIGVPLVLKKKQNVLCVCMRNAMTKSFVV